MATFSKAYNSLFALASIAASTVSKSSPADISTKMDGLLLVRFGRRSASAAGAGVNIRLEVSSSASVDNSWFPFAWFTTGFAACEGEALNATCNAGQKVLTVTSTTNLTVGDAIFIDDTVDITKSEWGRIKSIVANTSVTLEDDLVYTHLNSAIIYDSAEIYSVVAIHPAMGRIRAVIDGVSFTQAFACEVSYLTVEGIA